MMAQASRSPDDVNPVLTLRAQMKSDGGGIPYSSMQIFSIRAPFSPRSIQFTQRWNMGSSKECSCESAALAPERARRRNANHVRIRIGTPPPENIHSNWHKPTARGIALYRWRRRLGQHPRLERNLRGPAAALAYRAE